MTFASVIAVGVKLAHAVILGANTVEQLKGAVKGGEKRAAAWAVAQSSLGFCSENEQLPMTPKIRDKLNALNDAYVAYMNAVAEAAGGPPS